MSNAPSKKVPELRFPEFKGEWVEKRLEHGIILVSGQHLAPTEYNNKSSGIPYFTGPSDFTNDETRCTKWTNITGHTGQKDDVLITVKGNGVGSLLFLGLKEVAMGRQLMAVRSKEYSTQFVFYTLLIRNRLFQSLAAGNLIPGLSRKDILQAKVATPGISEQKKIAAFLSSVDGRIEGLEKKRDLLKEYKKGLMQKLFSQTLRFMDESGKPFPDWMEKRLEEIGRFIGGGTPSRGNGEYWTGNIPWISSSDLTEESIYEVRTTNFITETAVKESATKIVPANSILIVSRVGVGKVAVNKEPLCTSQDFTSLYLGSGNVTFFAYAIKKEIPRLLSCNQGTSIKGFVKSDLAELDILIPCLEEQKKIAECLSAVDRKIEAVEAQVSRTREFKQGLLQKMFV